MRAAVPLDLGGISIYSYSANNSCFSLHSKCLFRVCSPDCEASEDAIPFYGVDRQPAHKSWTPKRVTNKRLPREVVEVKSDMKELEEKENK